MEITEQMCSQGSNNLASYINYSMREESYRKEH